MLVRNAIWITVVGWVCLVVCSSLVQGNSFGWCPCCCLPFCGLLLCKFMVAIMQHYRKTGPFQRCFVFCHRTVPIYLLQTFTVSRLTSPICWRFLKCGNVRQIAKNQQFSCGNKLAQELGWITENRAIAVLKQLMKLGVYDANWRSITADRVNRRINPQAFFHSKGHLLERKRI